MKTTTFYLATVGTTAVKPALTLGQGLPTEIEGQPVDYKWKELIRTGDYIHPDYGWKLAVDVKRMKGWTDSFNAMKTNGVKVPTPKSHASGADNLGYLIELKLEGDSLWGLHQLIGDDAIKASARNESSLAIDPKFKDGKGREYGEAIIHNAIISDPVVTGLKGFMPAIAASRGQASDGLLFVLAASTKGASMGMPTEQLERIRKIVGVADLSEADAVGKLIDFADIQRAAATANLSRAEAAEGQVVTLSRAVPKSPDASVIEEIAEMDEIGFDSLVEKGAITADVSTKLKTALVGAKDKRNTIALSRAGDTKRLSRVVIDILKENKPVAPGTVTGVQVLSRQTPGGEVQPDAKAEADAIAARVNRIQPHHAKR